MHNKRGWFDYDAEDIELADMPEVIARVYDMITDWAFAERHANDNRHNFLVGLHDNSDIDLTSKNEVKAHLFEIAHMNVGDDSAEDYAMRWAGQLVGSETGKGFGYRGDDDFEFRETHWAAVFLYGDYSDKSGLLWESNADALEKELAEFGDDIGIHHGGYYSVYLAIKVFDENWRLTDAFRKFAELWDYVEEHYPVLDEDDYSEREFEASLEHTAEGLEHLDLSKHDLEWNQVYSIDGWANLAADVLHWLYDNEDSDIGKAVKEQYRSEYGWHGYEAYPTQSVDDTGAWPSDPWLLAAIKDLNLVHDICPECGEDLRRSRQSLELAGVPECQACWPERRPYDVPENQLPRIS